jgi:hypothetical protein
MNLSRVITVTLITFSMTALTARAADEVPAAAPESVAAPQAAPDAMAMPMPGMGPGAMMRGMGGGMNKPCPNPGMGKMAGGKPNCQGKAGRCNMAGDERRVEALEKRIDALQMTVEMLVRQQNSGAR